MKKDKICKYCGGPAHSETDLMQIMRLDNCRVSTDKGQIDQGFPRIMKVMEGRGWVKPVGKGFQITNEGRIFLNVHKQLLPAI